LVVDPDFRSNGIGKQLMVQGERILREKGFTSVTLGIRYGDRYGSLKQFYEKQGYGLLGPRTDNAGAIFGKGI